MTEQIRDVTLWVVLAVFVISLACFPDDVSRLMFFVGL